MAVAVVGLLIYVVNQVTTSVRTFVAENAKVREIEDMRQAYRNRMNCTKSKAGATSPMPATCASSPTVFIPYDHQGNNLYDYLHAITKSKSGLNRFEFETKCANVVGYDEFIVHYRDVPTPGNPSPTWIPLFKVNRLCS